jgi:glyceraldehyde 3-phosphate dehydrogenase
MATRVAINGFGRIGRGVLRSGWNDPEIEFVHINDLTSIDTLAHLLEFDTVHGRWRADISADGGDLVINGKRIPVTAERDPANLPWKESRVDTVLECTGVFRKRAQAMLHLDAGAGRVIISAPASDPDATVVMGVNDDTLKASDRIVSNASCTTNCLAPVVKVLDEKFGIVAGLMCTVHSYTMDQRLLDAPHKDLRRGRAAAANIVPTSTGAAKAVGLVLPQLDGKLNGYAIRVPTPNVSLVDLTVTTRDPVSVEAINAAMQAAADTGSLAGFLATTSKPVVSSDMVGEPASSTVDLALTQTMGPNMAKVVTWYDNEWGFSSRMLDLVKRLAGLEK